MPKCPFCNHYMAPGAKKCYNCGYDREEWVKGVEGSGCKTAIIILIISTLFIGYLMMRF